MHISVRRFGCPNRKIEDLGRPDAESVGNQHEACDRRHRFAMLDPGQERWAERTRHAPLPEPGGQPMESDGLAQRNRKRRPRTVACLFSNS
jgi:hypothetical protein